MTKNGESIQLHCILSSKDSSKSNDATTSKAFLTQETGKKSSFLLDPSPESTEYYAMEKPAEVIIENRGSPENRSKDRQPFFLGGFQIVSNARNVEVYVCEGTTADKGNGKETYVMTSRGIAINDDNKDGDVQWHKAVSVIPGGPRSITSLRIKILSLRPAGETIAKLKSIKITGRVAEPTSTSIKKANTSDPTKKSVAPTVASNKLPQNAESVPAQESNSLTQSDLGAAMAGFSMMARSTEERLAKSMEFQCSEIENKLANKLSTMETNLLWQVATQNQLIKEQNQVILNQKQSLLQNEKSMAFLMEQQAALLSAVNTLTEEVRLLKPQSDANAMESPTQPTKDENGQEDSAIISTNLVEEKDTSDEATKDETNDAVTTESLNSVKNESLGETSISTRGSWEELDKEESKDASNDDEEHESEQATSKSNQDSP